MTCRPDPLRIGGEFEFFPDDYKEVSRNNFPVDFTKRHCLWTDTGRSALLIAATAILHRGGKPRVWIPAFSCRSISQPFRQAGFDIKYYPVGANLMGDGVSLPQPAAGETLLFIHYFGHRNDYMSQAARAYRSAGVWVVEDYVQGSLMRELGDDFDFAVTSYRKLMPVVDGAALLSAFPIDVKETGLQLADPDESFVSEKFMGKLLRACNAASEDFLPLLEHAENHLADHVIPRKMSWLSAWMMERVDFGDTIIRRRENWLSLREEILKAKLADRARPLFTALGNDDVPLGMPVHIVHGKRDPLRAYLAARQIYCPIHWTLDHLPNHELFTNERELESSVLTFPIDQRMSAAHVTRLIQELMSYFTKTTAGNHRQEH